MSTIGDIITTIEKLPIGGDGALTLKSSDFELGFMDSVFGKMLFVDTLSISAAARDKTATSIAISGSADILGYTDLTCVLAFEETNGKVTATVTATFATNKTIKLPLIDWVETGNIVLTTSISEGFELTGLGFSMAFLLQNGDTIPIALALQQSTMWRLDIADGTDQGITGEDIVYLLGGEALDNFLPTELTDALDGFKLNGIAAEFDTKAKTLPYFNTGITVTNGWNIAPGVALEPGLQIGLTITDATDKVSRQTVGQVDATFKLGKTNGVEVPIMIGATFGQKSSWTFGLQPGESVTIPSFSDLLALAGGDEFMETLPSGLSEIPAIRIDKLATQFEPADKALTLLSFAIETDSNWPVIENYFEVRSISIAFDITDLTDKTKRDVLGDMTAVFFVGPVGLMVELKKTKENSNWTIIAGLAPDTSLNMTQIAAELFEGQVELPDDVPKIIFDDLKITVVPEKKSFAFEAGSDTPWVLIQDKLSIENLGLNFSREVVDNKGQVKGQVSSTLDIAGVELTLKASLNDTPDGGWSFSGSQGTAPIPIGKLISDLVNWFGTVTLPSILEGLEIYGLATTFNTKTKNFTFTCLLKDTALPDLSLLIDIVIENDTTKPGTYKKTFTGTATYKSDDMDLSFELTFVDDKSETGKSTQTIAKYNATKPPTLAQFVTFVAEELKFDANIPQAMNFDAALDSLTLQLDKKDADPLRVESAGLFQMTFGESEPWNLYLSYTNDAYFESVGKESRADGPAGKPAYIFGVALSGALDLSNLPLVGRIPGVDDLKIDKLGFYYTDAPFTATDKKLNFAVASLGTETPLAPTPDKAFLDQSKFSLMASFGNKSSKDGTTSAMPLGTDTGTPPTNSPPVIATKQADPRKPISWLSVNKSLGPVQLDKIGLGYAAPGKDDKGELGIVGIYVNGGFSVAGLEMALERLGISFPLPMPGGSVENPMSKIKFHLGGMAMSYKTSSFEIGGGFINLSDGDDVNMIGEFTVKVGNFGIEAYGGYADTIGKPSLFIFLHLNAPLGGPPYFFINGVSGGFGINRDFVLPTFSELGSYPLLPTSPGIPTAGDLAGKSNEEKLDTMTQSLLSLAKYFPVKDGQYWFAVGLDVSSFEMIEVSAILSVAFGVDLQIAVLGSASMTLPVKVPKPVAYVQINFSISYSSSNNLLAVMGVITPSSYLFDGVVKVSGGFAFFTWLGGENLGDFVLTLGGYNSRYIPPPHYPKVPRIEMRAGIGPVNMVGQAYFALLPSAFMAGFSIKATADLGPIKAWFDASLDFMMAWKPFHYEARAGIQLGASFTLDLGFTKVAITIQVGVLFECWGPEFGGQATVDLAIISFTITFGAPPEPAPPLSWGEFNDFLPSDGKSKNDPKPLFAAQTGGARFQSASMIAMAPVAFRDATEDADTSPADDTAAKPLVTINVKTGMLKHFPEGKEVDGLTWIIDANDFEIRTNSTAPTTVLDYNGDTLPADYPYLTPGNLKEQIAERTDLGKPYFVYKASEGTTPWYDQKYGIPPMQKENVEITHRVTFQKLPLPNAPPPKTVPNAESDVIATLSTSGVPPSLWGNAPVSTTKVPDAKDAMIDGALVGLQFTPMIWFPKRTTFIPYYYLVLNTNNLGRAQSTAPKLRAPDFGDPDPIYKQMQSGAAFKQTQTARTAITDTLKGVGFDHLALKNSASLSTQDYVADPRLVHMSSTSETNLG